TEGARFWKLLCLSLKIRHLNYLSIKHRAPRDRAANRRDHESRGVGDRAMVGHRVQRIAIYPENDRVVSGTQSGGALRNGVEYRLYVGGRTCDHPQDLARRRLLLQRLGQVLIASLQLGEQAHVLDGDDGLIGEGLEERALLRSGGTRFSARDGD